MNDRDALCLVLNRLNADVGGLFNLVEKHNSECEEDDQRLWPFWAFSRMLFPVAEAVGYLVYGKGNSWDLIEILENEFESVRTGYRGKAALIVLLFRHSLIHTDELRILCFNGIGKIGWIISWASSRAHLKILKQDTAFPILHFSPQSFYEDLVVVCNNLLRRDFDGLIAKRYERWKTYDIHVNKHGQNGSRKGTGIENRAMDEFKDILKT